MGCVSGMWHSSLQANRRWHPGHTKSRSTRRSFRGDEASARELLAFSGGSSLNQVGGEERAREGKRPKRVRAGTRGGKANTVLQWELLALACTCIYIHVHVLRVVGNINRR